MKRGGKCEHCGYNANLSALEFHHRNPEEKEFQIDIRAFSNYSLEKLEAELDKCELLCSNCHKEHHHPAYTPPSLYHNNCYISSQMVKLVKIMYMYLYYHS